MMSMIIAGILLAHAGALAAPSRRWQWSVHVESYGLADSTCDCGRREADIDPLVDGPSEGCTGALCLVLK